MTAPEWDLIHLIRWLDEVRSSPAPVARRASAALRRSEVDQGHVGLLNAILARAAMAHHDMDGAVRLARLAVDQESAAVPPLTRAEVRTILAFALTLAGRLDEAAAVLGEADRVLGQSAQGIVDIQRSVVLYRQGELLQALAAADRALAALPADRAVDRARALNNRAILGLYLGQLAAAQRDFDRAEATYRSVGMVRYAADVVHNRAMVTARYGDLARALREFKAAEDELAGLGVAIDEKIVARAEVLALAGLHEDVLEEVPAAVERLDACGMRADAAEGRLYIAMSSLSLGEATAADVARHAAAALRTMNRTGWAAIADDVAFQSELAIGGPAARPPPEAAAIAAALDACGMRLFAAGSWLRAAQVAEAHGQLDLARSSLDRIRTRRGSLAMRLMAHEARAARHLLDGQIVETRRAIRNGRLLLWRHRLLFGSTELRAHASSWGAGLADLDLRLSWDRSPRALFEAADVGVQDRSRADRSRGPRTPRRTNSYPSIERFTAVSSGRNATARRRPISLPSSDGPSGQ